MLQWGHCLSCKFVITSLSFLVNGTMNNDVDSWVGWVASEDLRRDWRDGLGSCSRLACFERWSNK